jgi:hypothetical protein
MPDPHVHIAELLRRFTSGQDRSMKLAGQLEVAIDEAFPEDEEWQDLMVALAMYRPEGGPNLFNEEQMAIKCKRGLERLSSAG